MKHCIISSYRRVSFFEKQEERNIIEIHHKITKIYDVNFINKLQHFTIYILVNDNKCSSIKK